MKRYLSGPATTGKTTQLTQQLVSLITAGTRPDRILVVVPQLVQGARFRNALAQVRGNTRGEPQIGTIYSLAQQHVTLFFPLIASEVGFAGSAQEPTFINVEAAQFFLNQIIQPRLSDFDDLKMYRPRMLSQILDSMNKAALNGYELTELAPRLGAAWSGNASRLASYQRMQDAAVAYRAYCLDHNLLDFSLTMHIFTRHLLQARSYQDYVAARYRHVLADNIEEGTPALHDFLRLVLQTADTAMLVEDDPGGYRLFLGADPQSARSLKTLFKPNEIEQVQPRANPSPIAQFGTAIMQQFAPQAGPRRQQTPPILQSNALESPIETGAVKYWVQQIDWVVARILQQVEAGVAPSDIAVLAPYVEDVLRFELNERLQPHGIGVRSLRPSRPLYDHPVTRAMATFARLANPHWEQPVSNTELARALSITITDLDVIRAQLIADAALKVSPNSLAPLEDAAVWSRVGPRFQERYAQLQQWLEPWRLRSLAQLTESRMVVYGQTSVGVSATPITANDMPPLDIFWQHLFTEVLSQPGFRLSTDVTAPDMDIDSNTSQDSVRDGAIVCDKLIRSARQFREVFEDAGIAELEALSREVIPVLGLSERPVEWPTEDVNLAYLHLLSEGIMAAQYTPERAAVVSTTTANEMEVVGKNSSTSTNPSGNNNEILLSTVYAYLTGDVRSRVQFWLDVASSGWYERIYQPLTHPYVLSRSWNGLPWMEEDEHRAAQDMMRRIVGGLTARCSDKLYLVSSQLSMGGQDEAGPLLRAVQRIIPAPLF